VLLNASLRHAPCRTTTCRFAHRPP
jgi:hypothetical protein